MGASIRDSGFLHLRECDGLQTLCRRSRSPWRKTSARTWYPVFRRQRADFLFSLVNPLFRGCLQGKNDSNTCENSTDHFNWRTISNYQWCLRVSLWECSSDQVTTAVASKCVTCLRKDPTVMWTTPQQLDHPNKPATEPGSVRRGRRSSKILEASFVAFLLEESVCRADRAAYSSDLRLKTFAAVFCFF